MPDRYRRLLRFWDPWEWRRMVGILGPCISTSRSPTRLPTIKRAMAIFTATVLLPTPPFPDNTTTLCRMRQRRDWSLRRSSNSSGLSSFLRRDAEQSFLLQVSQDGWKLGIVGMAIVASPSTGHSDFIHYQLNSAKPVPENIMLRSFIISLKSLLKFERDATGGQTETENGIICIAE